MTGEREASASGEDPHQGWGAVAGDFMPSAGKDTLWSVSWSFMRAPVETIVRLTDDPAYRTQWGFLSAWLGAQLTLAYVILPKLLGAYFAVPAIESKSAVLTNEIVQYAGIAILTPIQYYLCRFLGTRRRSPMAYVKFCALSVGFCAMITTAIVLTFWIAGATLTAAGITVDTGSLGFWLIRLGQISIIVFAIVSHRRFWGMTWPIAVFTGLAIAALSWIVVYPLLNSAASSLDIANRIERMTG